MRSLIQRSNFLTKLFHWEFWPASIANIPVVFYWLFFAFKSRDLFFFSLVNPSIETGGVMGESKIKILNNMPRSVIPQTVFFGRGELQIEHFLDQMRAHMIDFPVICKPNVGERGFLVEKISSEEALERYLAKVQVDLLIQEYVEYPVELSILCHRFPSDGRGQITSICEKKYLSVAGDGVSTIETLMQKSPRARMQLKRFRREKEDLLNSIPAAHAEVIVEPIGNHCRGTMFLDANHLISDKLHDVFISLLAKMEDVNYGRFDLKCKNVSDLSKGLGYKVLEFNGVASEPAHIYDPSYPTIQGYRDLFQHWKIIYEISQEQRGLGKTSMGWTEALRSLKDYFKHMRNSRQRWNAEYIQ